MKLTFQNQKFGDVVVIRCAGRIVIGDEVRALQLEIEKFNLETKKFVLDLEHVAYIDSGGLGALVRLMGILRASRGDLKLCQVSPFLAEVFAATNLKGFFHTYAAESEAITAFSQRRPLPLNAAATSHPRVICIDSSGDLLAYLSALLKHGNYEVYTSKFLSDAVTLVKSMHPRLAICGPTTQVSPAAFEKLRHADPQMQVLVLPSDFHASEAGQAGTELLQEIETLLNCKQS